MIVYYLVFFAGLLLGTLFCAPFFQRVAYWGMVACGQAMIGIFGWQMIASPELRGALPLDILTALLLAFLAASGSVAGSYVLIKAVVAFLKNADEQPGRPKNNPAVVLRSRFSEWKPVLLSLSFLLAGMFCGAIVTHSVPVAYVNGFLFPMIVAVGVQCGQELFTTLKTSTTSVVPRGTSLLLLLFLPVAVMGGSLLFALLAAPFISVTGRECMLCVAPMGWQTLGGPMVQNLCNAHLGNLAFLANMFRDVVALLMIPWVGRFTSPLLCVTPGGVSSMDILLPGILATAGRPYLIYAMWVGASCSFWAPILIYLIAKAG